MKIAFVVAGNGFGHLKRVCSVVKHIFDLSPHTHVLLIGATAHQAMLSRWHVFEQFRSCNFEFINAFTEQNLLAVLPDSYIISSYQQSWIQINACIDAFRPDRIVSDNLAGVLNYYPQSVLMGSFLFSDTLWGRSPELDRICELENNLLARVKPIMLGVNDMAMPGVRTKTNFIGLPWFCEGINPPVLQTSGEKKHILITGGGTKNAHENLLKVSDLLVSAGFKISLDQSLYAAADRSDFNRFDFSENSFQELDWIICRPGIGILTDAVQYGIPVGALYETDAEMQHNAQRVEQLQLGLNISENSFLNLPDMLRQDTTPLKDALRERETGGALAAARYILNC